MPASYRSSHPTPPFTIFVDRDDGTEWAVSWEEIDGTRYISIIDNALVRANLRPRTDFIRWPANSGASIGAGIRLFVRGGYLGMEILEGPEVRTYNPHARVGVQRDANAIHLASIPGQVAWTEENVYD